MPHARTQFHPTLFWSKVLVTSNPDKCWLWHVDGHLPGGYPQYVVKEIGKPSRAWRANRFAFTLFYGHEPKGILLHSCDNPRCVNPHHLSEGTHADNMADCIAKGRNAKGSDFPHARLTEEQVKEIRERLSKGGTASVGN
jgi:hypothetical protein